MDWHVLSRQEVIASLTTHAERGLASAEAAARLVRHGPNELVETGTKSPWRILWEQFTAVMVLILIAAAGLSLFLGKYLEAGAILTIVVLFGLLGFFQEYRAEQAIAALRRLAVPTVRVVRDGVAMEISARELAQGDIVVLEAGNVIPADLRLIEAVNLRVQEAALTGESEPVEKAVEPLPNREVPLGDRINMAYMGTLVTYGRGRGVVVGSGMGTELGKIATLIQSVAPESTPLQERLDAVGKALALGGIVVALLVFGIGIAGGETMQDMLLTAISVAVAVIPEGLPAVVTLTLALGAQRMLRRNALIRKLPAVETLGSVTTICSDKTGTLTENRMTVTVIDVAGHRLEVDESLRGGHPEAGAAAAASVPEAFHPAPFGLVLIGGALCNDASLRRDPEDGRLVSVGDPTEAALLVAALAGGLRQDALLHLMPRTGELPFDSERKRMTTVHPRPAQGGDPHSAFAVLQGLAAPYIAFTKGAVDGLLELSTAVWTDGRLEPLSDAWRTRILGGNTALAGNGMRVLGVAFRPVDSGQATPETERDLIFVGMLGIIDPPRTEVKEAVARCVSAGIRPVMITGDHPLTAVAIARELGISSGSALTGTQLNALSEEELDDAVRNVSVFARVSPEHKLRIVNALQRQGEVVAMTGDGVNDAPALKQSDIGVAMGITGTDVSKEAADMVLRDDNFATIIAAVEEGRVIYDNLRRFVKFAVAGNIGKVAVMLLWPVPFVVLGRPMTEAVALLPLQLLWLNLMTDGLLGLSLGVEPAEKHVMQRPPNSPEAGIFSGGMAGQVVWTGLFIGLVTLGVGFAYHELRPGGPWQTLMFTMLAIMQVFQALGTRSDRESLYTLGLGTNPVMLGIIALVVCLQVAAVYAPFISTDLLRVQPLGATEWLLAIGAGVAMLLATEGEKWWLRRRR
jgi:P-type Ca2+ transporter type 2C